ncbi:hypothetical protein GGR51DRAFT_567631 [Nemania sp. FL0031]|nr:hypothetical protein GGR51DRAFT_567631 [Nemania sp. FL0031]
MFRSFQPTQASREGNADSALQRYLSSRAGSSMNWRERALSETPSPPRPIALVRGVDGKVVAKEDWFRHEGVGTSPNYRGDRSLPSNHSAAIPDSENTSLWVTGFPRDSTSYRSLMNLLEGRGKIRATNMIQDNNKGFRTTAATITFFRHVDAENTMFAINAGILRAPLPSRIATESWIRQISDSPVSAAPSSASASAADSGDDRDDSVEIKREEETLIDFEPTDTRALVARSNRHIGGIRLRACWNRVRVPEWKSLYFNPKREHPGPNQFPSRVIRVRGPASEVRPASLEVYFQSKFHYKLDRVIFRGTKDGREEYEYRFASWKNQAEFAVMSIRCEKFDIMVWYGVDPCEVVNDNIHLLDQHDLNPYLDIPALTATDSSAEAESVIFECD